MEGICFPPDPTIIPAGTISTCRCYTQYSGIDSEYTNCTTMTHDYGLTLAELQLMNPWLAGSLSTCDTALFANLVGEDGRQICIRRNGTTTLTTGTTTSRTSTTTSSTTSTTSSWLI